MKKVITLMLFVFAVTLGTQSIKAQTSRTEINAMAAEKTESLQKIIKLDDKQLDEVFKVFQAYIQKKMVIKENPSNEKQALKDLNEFRDEKLKLVLTEEQFKRYLTLKK